MQVAGSFTTHQGMRTLAETTQPLSVNPFNCQESEHSQPCMVSRPPRAQRGTGGGVGANVPVIKLGATVMAAANTGTALGGGVCWSVQGTSVTATAVLVVVFVVPPEGATVPTGVAELVVAAVSGAAVF